MIPVDRAARQRIAADLDCTLIVEAAAGTGKTTALVGRIVSILRAGRTGLDKVVAVTFTENAATTMSCGCAPSWTRRATNPLTRASEPTCR